jgi:hypothetical protein
MAVLSFNLSHRDIEVLLAERGIIVSYEAIGLLLNTIEISGHVHSPIGKWQQLGDE